MKIIEEHGNLLLKNGVVTRNNQGGRWVVIIKDNWSLSFANDTVITCEELESIQYLLEVWSDICENEYQNNVDCMSEREIRSQIEILSNGSGKWQKVRLRILNDALESVSAREIPDTGVGIDPDLMSVKDVTGQIPYAGMTKGELYRALTNAHPSQAPNILKEINQPTRNMFGRLDEVDKRSLVKRRSVLDQYDDYIKEICQDCGIAEEDQLRRDIPLSRWMDHAKLDGEGEKKAESDREEFWKVFRDTIEGNGSREPFMLFIPKIWGRP